MITFRELWLRYANAYDRMILSGRYRDAIALTRRWYKWRDKLVQSHPWGFPE